MLSPVNAAGLASAITAATIALTFALPTTARADVDQADDADPANLLWDCAARHVPFGDGAQDVLRCLTFDVPSADDIRSAVLYLDIDAPTNSLQDTDSLVVAVDEPFAECSWAQGSMAGCVVVHGGFRGGERSLVVDLLDLGCDPTVTGIDAARQDAVRDALGSGTLHVMLQDDTAVNGAWLDVNGAAPPASCGVSTDAVPLAVVTGTASGGGDAGAPIAAIVLGGAALIVGVPAGTTVSRRMRTRRARRTVRVDRVPDDGAVTLDRDPHERSVAIGIRTQPDDLGVQTLERASP